MLIQVTERPIYPEQVIASLKREVHGAVVTFMGTVRRFTGDRRVQFLDYEAYPEMAEQKLRQIAREVIEKYQVEDVSIVHRTGRLAVGETSLIVALASPHRREGFDACLHAVERIKEVVPVWKKEIWDGGAAWVHAEGA